MPIVVSSRVDYEVVVKRQGLRRKRDKYLTYSA